MISSTLCSADFRIVGNVCAALVKAIPTHHCAEHFYTNKQGFLRVGSKYLKYKPKGENLFSNNLWGVQWQQNSRGRKYLYGVCAQGWRWSQFRVILRHTHEEPTGWFKSPTWSRYNTGKKGNLTAKKEMSSHGALSKDGKGRTRAKSKDWGRTANVSVLGQTQDGRTVAKNNPTFSLALWIVLTQHHLVQLRIQTLDASLISTCRCSVVSREIEARKW